MVSLGPRAADLSLPVVPLQVCPAGLAVRGAAPPWESGGKDEEAGIIVLEGLRREAGRGFQAECFHPLALLLVRLGGKHLNAEGCSAFTCLPGSAGLSKTYLHDTWAGCCGGLLQVRPFGIKVNSLVESE